ncbi:MAG: Sodium/proline symporter [Firmicutes bacterium ADurb.Bin193]|nr:MAG: Sodium/proline symporter [Firmicutes bacterium ADurb.Bin193]
MDLKYVMLLSMGAYMIAVIIIGFITARRTKTTADYYLGGRTLGPWIAAMSAEASDMSSWLLMGLPGVAYLLGVADATWTAIGLAVGTYLNWLLVARRLRTYTIVANDSITLPDFFSNRFHDKNRILMSVSALIILVFFIPYTASGFAACGKLFNSLYGFDYMTAMLISAAVVVLYTAIGGFLAESITDLVQGFIMSFALIVILIFGVIYAGGVGAVIDNASKMSGFLSMFQMHLRESNSASPYGIFTIVSTLAWGLGYFGMPHILLRFMAISSTKELKKSRIIACTWCFISLAAAILIGLVGAVALPDLLKGSANMASDSETVFIKLAELLSSYGVIAAIFAGIIISGILAATMSTSDSQLLVASSSIAQNFFKGYVKKNATEKQVMWIARATVILIAVISAYIARDPYSNIFDIVSYAWAGFGAAFGPVILFSLFWKRTTLLGALSGMLSGAAMVVIWDTLGKTTGGVFKLYELLPAFIIACIFIVVVSLIDKKPSDEIQTEFDKVKASV